MDPWVAVVLLGVAITGYAWMMPKASKQSEFDNIAAYDQLLEDLELENRELVDAVAKFKREQDETVEKLGRKIVDMEHQMKQWTTQMTVVQSTQNFADTIETYAAVAAAEDLTVTIAEQSEIINPVSSTENELSSVIPDTSIRTRYAELLALHHNGKSVEQIAKAHGMNNGEVQLILQLARREGELDA
ncbi:MAG: hypothetical protein P0Y55_08980 [Candidatus Cohnella colombiensis]|uniref:DUF2802 domain-containing protein n=1 Tax=Candidatus Cohnella colombiensis TaxID=3121368 RepID=A0AA95F3F5_9BACL|nr:MAG: hypothetical protein P0Y55_08980 [Cohnella sp.]